MLANIKFLAWIEPSDGREFLAAFSGGGHGVAAEAGHARCAYPVETRRWVAVQSAEFGGPVELIDHPLSPTNSTHRSGRRQPHSCQRQRIALDYQPALRRRVGWLVRGRRSRPAPAGGGD
jgi:hypothetical protein